MILLIADHLTKVGYFSLIFVNVSYIHPIPVKKVKRHYREIYVVHTDDVTAEV